MEADTNDSLEERAFFGSEISSVVEATLERLLLPQTEALARIEASLQLLKGQNGEAVEVVAKQLPLDITPQVTAGKIRHRRSVGPLPDKPPPEMLPQWKRAVSPESDEKDEMQECVMRPPQSSCGLHGLRQSMQMDCTSDGLRQSMQSAEGESSGAQIMGYMPSMDSAAGWKEEPSKGSKGRRMSIFDGAPDKVRRFKRLATFTQGAHGVANDVRLFGAMQDMLKDQTELDEPEYDVGMFYKETGVFPWIARSGLFATTTMIFICSNAVYLGLDADYGGKDSPVEAWYFHACDNIFCVFFTLELCIRFFAFDLKRNCLKDTWFKFDCALVIIMILETWIVPSILMAASVSGGGLPTAPLRVIRLLRLLRLVRVMRALPELVTMMRGLAVATRAVGSSVLLLAMINYMCSIGMHSFLKEEDELSVYFGSVGNCMVTLVANGIFGDSLGIVLRSIKHIVPAFILFLSFVMLTHVTLANMLVGVLCEVVSNVAAAEKEGFVVSSLKKSVLQMLTRLDEDGNGEIDKEELLSLFRDEEAVTILKNLQVDLTYFIAIQDMYYSDGAICTIPQIMQALIRLQGSRHMTVQDAVDMHGFTRWSIQKDLIPMQLKIDRLEISCRKILQTLEGHDSYGNSHAHVQNSVAQRKGASLQTGDVKIDLVDTLDNLKQPYNASVAAEHAQGQLQCTSNRKHEERIFDIDAGVPWEHAEDQVHHKTQL